MNQTHFLAREHFQSLFDVLIDAGYRCLGPQVRDGAIVFDEMVAAAQLPVGVHDQQTPGTYRLSRSDSQRYFAWANGPQALKPFLFPPRETLWRAERDAEGRINFVQAQPAIQKTAVLVGMRVKQGRNAQAANVHSCAAVAQLNAVLPAWTHKTIPATVGPVITDCCDKVPSKMSTSSVTGRVLVS